MSMNAEHSGPLANLTLSLKALFMEGRFPRADAGCAQPARTKRFAVFRPDVV